jgi:hypothetical protein
MEVKNLKLLWVRLPDAGEPSVPPATLKDREPWVINTDKYAAYPPAIVQLKDEGARLLSIVAGLKPFLCLRVSLI